ncbi:MAG TPA: hypothetical protein VIP11_01705 [Gemmatimonadaceae bacterium]
MVDRDVNPTQGFKATKEQLGDWSSEETYWREHWDRRPYAAADRGFDYYRPGYRYGFESANRYRGREWNEAEDELRSGWDQYEHRNQSTWESIKEAVHDAWDHVRGRR